MIRHHQTIALEKLCLDYLNKLRENPVNYLNTCKQIEILDDLKEKGVNGDIEGFQKKFDEKRNLMKIAVFYPVIL